MTTDILYISYLHDLEWLQWSINTVRTNLTGYRNILVVCPEQDAPFFNRLDDIKVIPVPDWPGRGYYWQQFHKIRAWKYSDADFIAHFDSDTMVTAPTDIDDLFLDGLPCWMFQSYTSLPPNVPWQKPTEKALNLTVPDEYMRAFPFIIDPATHRRTEMKIVEEHGVSLEYYIRNAEAFSEFNCMGAYANHTHPERYNWFDTSTGEWPKAFRNIRQFWSHSPLSELTDELAAYAGKPPILTDFGVWVIPGDTHLCKWIREHRRLDFDHALIEREILPYIAQGDTVIDIGAFVGDHTLAYSRAVGPDGKVLAFEPNPEAFTCLYKNMQPFQNTAAVHVALGDRAGKASVQLSDNVGASYLVGGEGGVFTDTLDNFAFDINTRVNLIKIDAEGWELKILQGAEHLIVRDHPALVLEVNEGALQRQGATSKMLHDWLEAHGYTFRVISGVLGGDQYDILCCPGHT